MKKLLLFCILLTIVSDAWAQSASTRQTLECREPQHVHGGVIVDVESVVASSGILYSSATNARMFYNFSATAGMVCVGHGRDLVFDFSCVGYYYSNEVTELKVKTNEEGKTFATWTTNAVYGNIPMETECVLSDVQ